MFNNWFSIGPFTVHGYGVMIAVGILAAVAMAEKNMTWIIKTSMHLLCLLLYLVMLEQRRYMY